MAFDIVNAYAPNHKVWDHAGNAFPNVEHSEGIRPAGEFKPAAWLPVQFFDKYYENWYVTLPGKIIACDNDGDLVPAQYATSSVDIIYTADDVTEGTIDVETGVAVTAAKTVAVSGVTTFLGGTAALSCSKPLGVAPYGYLKWAGGDGDSNSSTPFQLRQHNYNMQHLVALLCDYVLILPLVPTHLSVAEALSLDSSVGSVRTMDALANIPVAKNTVRTTMVFSGADGSDFVLQVNALALVTAEGDWFINLETGVITIFRAAGGPTASLTYYYYSNATTAATVSVFASAVGDLNCGDFVESDDDSNFKLATSTDFRDIIGQVLEVIDFPRASLDKVRTSWQPTIGTDASGGQPGYSGQLDQMPGFATGGVPDYIHYAGAANLAVTINLISR